MQQLTRIKRNLTRLGLIGGSVAILTLAGAIPALANDTVVQGVTGSTLTASIADLNLAAVVYSHSGQPSADSMTLTADDSTGTGDGWNITVQSSEFAYSGANGGTAIAASAFAIGTPGTPSMTAGQVVDATNGPIAGVGGSLESARKVISAQAEYGMGTYTQSLPVTLTIPAMSRAGTYTATLTVTSVSGPGI